MSSTTPPAGTNTPKQQRVLACITCSARKVKCNRRFPCSNCIKSRVECVPSSLTSRPRRRRFPEKDLLDRVRSYEGLLRQHHVTFEPLHGEHGDVSKLTSVAATSDSDGEQTRTASLTAKLDVTTPLSTTVSTERPQTKNIWKAMGQGFRDAENDSDSSREDVGHAAVKRAWNQSAQDDNRLLFAASIGATGFNVLHPEPVQIFRLWQVYLDNVDPLLKVTHTPTLQARIVEAVSNIASIDHNLQALMFGIYCVAILSLGPQECQNMFDATQEDLSPRYGYGCQQALVRAGFLRTNDRDCLTALLLYLISVRPCTTPQSLSSTLGIAVRIAQRMGVHSEQGLSKHSYFEAELRRRLWWALVLFDSRISETADCRTLSLDPTWDCKVPLNVNDSDLRPEMENPPPSMQERTSPSEALFAVTRAEVGNFVRFSNFHLDFTTPSLRPLAAAHLPTTPHNGDLSTFEKLLDKQYFQHCDEGNPVHHIAIWTTRAQLARCRLLDHHSRFSDVPMQQRTEAQYDAATSFALQNLEANTRIMTSPSSRRFHWLNNAYFPFPAYLQIVQDLRRRSSSQVAVQGWKVMSANYMAWFENTIRNEIESAIFGLFGKMILQAWESCEESYRAAVRGGEVPEIVKSIREIFERRELQDERQVAALTAGTTETSGTAYYAFPASANIAPGMPLNAGFVAGNSTSAVPDLYSPAGQSMLEGYMMQYWVAMGGQAQWTPF